MPIRLVYIDEDSERAGAMPVVLARMGFSTVVSQDPERSLQSMVVSPPQVILLAGQLKSTTPRILVQRIRGLATGPDLGIVILGGLKALAPVGPDPENEGTFLADGWVEDERNTELLQRVLSEVAFRRGGAMNTNLPQSEQDRIRNATQTTRSEVAAELESGPSLFDRLSGYLKKSLQERSASAPEDDKEKPSKKPEGKKKDQNAPVDGVFSGTRPIKGVTFVAASLVALARDAYTGVVQLKNEKALCKIAFLQGLVVGARDNNPDNYLGERLLRAGLINEEGLANALAHSKKEKIRIGEAFTDLELCTAHQVMEELDGQARDALLRAVGWSAGTIKLVGDANEVRALVSSDLDLQALALRALLRTIQTEAAERFVEKNMGRAIAYPDDLQNTLHLYQRVAGYTPLLSLFPQQPESLQVVLDLLPEETRGEMAPHLHGIFSAGLFWFSDEGEKKPVPKKAAGGAFSSQDVTLDLEKARAYRREWLRIRNLNLYQVLQVHPASSPDAIFEALNKYKAAFGPEGVEPERLGSAKYVAEDIWSTLDVVEGVLMNPETRSHYDAELRGEVANQESSFTEVLDTTGAFMEGRLALSQGDLDRARGAFEKALQNGTDDPEYVSYLGYTLMMQGADLLSQARALLEKAAASHPEALHPTLFLGHLALAQGRTMEARAYFLDARKRSPEHPDVLAALQLVELAQSR
jgi:tetratricopeptide (TPR) repeat protein